MSIPDVLFERFAPSPKLSLYVEHFWIVSARAEKTSRREILIPNGRPMLLLSFASPSVRIDVLTGNRLPNSNMLFGIASRPFVIEQFGESRYIGVQFKPYGLAAFLRGDKLVNQALSIDEWLGTSDAEALNSLLLAHEFGRARVEALDTYLRSLAAEVDGPEVQLLGSTIDRIEQAGGQVKVDQLAQQLHMHYTTFYRMFKNYVGIGPKLYLDIVRYYTFVGGLLSDYPNDSDRLIASLEGYYDQAHASKEFRRFTGVTPNSFRTTLNNIAKLMHQS
jgi:AraC-like DNA-binding protein